LGNKQTGRISMAAKHSNKHYVEESDEEEQDEEGKWDWTEVRERLMAKQFDMDRRFSFDDRVKKRLKEMTKTKSQVAGTLLDKSYIIKIYLCGVRPEIWRRLRVPASITLNALHDKVLCPAMGWCRNYHGYYFADLPRPKVIHLPIWDREIGEVYGPITSEAVDMMHCGMYGILIVDDTKLQLAQILNKKGQKVEYMYDLGDQYRHKILLEEIQDANENNKGVIELLDGQNACPPEDGKGNFAYSENLCILDKGSGSSNKKYQEVMQQANHSSNYRLKHNFDPTKFDLKKTKVVVNEVLKTPKSNNDGSNMYTYNFQTGETTGGETLGMEKLLVPMKECIVCGVKEDLKKCARCRIVYYCCKEHQTTDWKRHKMECQKDTKA